MLIYLIYLSREIRSVFRKDLCTVYRCSSHINSEGSGGLLLDFSRCLIWITYHLLCLWLCWEVAKPIELVVSHTNIKVIDDVLYFLGSFSFVDLSFQNQRKDILSSHKDTFVEVFAYIESFLDSNDFLFAWNPPEWIFWHLIIVYILWFW